MDWNAVSGSPNSFAPRSAAYPVGAGLLLPEPPGFAGRIILLALLVPLSPVFRLLLRWGIFFSPTTAHHLHALRTIPLIPYHC